ncbi:MAG: type VII secretion-associated protein [Mycobacterium sp.]|uniref:type VII secretion-associated protein n=1 Tax=Mycobacterium sp. TaxID=1785 RepID=UPI001EB71CC7|nr:type VII secretion-associated protein [Mycobacterium sp.]MBV8787450.1 type VII secretion-associated protein [Mycobacterium sp.]
MSQHRAIVAAGPGVIRRLCCDTEAFVDAERIDAALSAIDDDLAIVGERPVAVDSLWRTALRSAICPTATGVVLVHPSWWSPSRVGVLTDAAADAAGDVLTRPRSWLLRRQAPDVDPEVLAVVEIAERLVAIVGTEVSAVPRTAEPQRVAQDVANVIAGTAAAVVLVDAPSAVPGARELATIIADLIRDSARTVVEIDDAGLAQLAAPATADPPAPRAAPRVGRVRSHARSALAAAAIVSAAAAPAVATTHRPDARTTTRVESAPTTFLVEGRVALSVPANWPTQRIVGGPGSARVQVTSPSDPEVALHVTQSPVAGETLSGTAERLKRAMDAEPAGVFVDFNPTGSSAGRPAVTYREVRADHHVWWTVLLDGPVRISVGCQSRPGREDAVHAVCEQAVRTAHAV